MKNNPTWMPVVAVALFDGEGRFLMHRRPPGKAHAGMWEFPGGKVELQENPVKAMIREAAEELGIVVEPDALAPLAFAESDGTDGKSGIVILLYTCREWQGEPASLEGGEVAWLTLEMAEKLEMPPLDVELLKRVSGK